MSEITNVGIQTLTTETQRSQPTNKDIAQKIITQEAQTDGNALPVDTVELSARAQSVISRVSVSQSSGENLSQMGRETANEPRAAESTATAKADGMETLAETTQAPPANVQQRPAAAPAATNTAVSEEEEEASSSTNVSTMSEYQMMELVMEGSLSRSEMEAELARRGVSVE